MESGDCFCIHVVQSIKFRIIAMSTNLTIEKEKDREKEKVGDRPAKLNKENSDRELERDKKQRRHFLLEEKHETLVRSGGEKMRNASGHQDGTERQ